MMHRVLFFYKNSHIVSIKRSFNVINLNNKPKIEDSKFSITKQQKEEIKKIFGTIYNFGAYNLDLKKMNKKNLFCITQYPFKDKNNVVCT